MIKHGCPEDFALRIFQQLEGFGEYGFPESHAASFAKLAYVSAWLKRHEPEAFLAALLNSQPMGFYSPRSEEHTSELQSLMRISYAVFCLKKKKTNIQYTT